MNISLIWQSYKLFRSGDSFGDAAGIKACAFSPAETGELAEKALAMSDFHYQPISQNQLAKLPQTSLGFQYYQFLEDHGLQIMNLSAKYHGHYSKCPITLRYVRIHDLVHVVTGFDPSVAGELGVYAFAAAQNFSQPISRAYRFARTVSPLIKPTQLSLLRKVDKLGWSLGKQAQSVILYPFENNLHKTIYEVRQELNLPAEPQTSS